MNEFIVGDLAEEGNMFYEYLKRYESKIRCFLMNTGGVGEIPNPQNLIFPLQFAHRPGKKGIGYMTRALFRDTAMWSDFPDFGTKVVTGGVYDEDGDIFNMNAFNPYQLYDVATREELVKNLKRERIRHLERFPNLDPRIKEAIT
jgi:phosphoenolpyruvate carboxykinase (ATP)